MSNAHAKGISMDTDGSKSHVTGTLSYLVPTENKPCNYMFQPPEGVPWENCQYERRPCRIFDARQIASALSLELNGFDLLDSPSTLSDFQDDQQVSDIYYREVEALAIGMMGGGQAVAFDHLYRQRDATQPTLSFGRAGNRAHVSAVGRVHNDYTEHSGRHRRNLVLPDMPYDRPFAILNFWRPVHHAALDTPLAVCDTRSFPKQDWVEADIIYPQRTGEIYLARYSASHRWYYYPSMTPDEVLVFKTYDSRLDIPARMTAHCAFDDPAAPADALPRRSIEARCLVLLD
jgi:hypothetical protein